MESRETNIPPEVQAAFDAHYEELASFLLPTEKAKHLGRIAQEMAGENWDNWKFEMLASASARIPNFKQRYGGAA